MIRSIYHHFTPPHDLRVPDLAGHVVPVNVLLLQEHVQTPLVLRQRVAGDFIDESLQAFASLLDKRLLEQTIVATERKLTLPRLAGQCRDNDLQGDILSTSRVECHND